MMRQKIVIPVMFGPYEDELLESWVSRLAKANCMPLSLFRNTYFMEKLDIRHRTQAQPQYYQEGLFWMSQAIRGFPSADKLLLAHTLLPFGRSTGDDIITMARKVQAVLYNCGVEEYDIDYIHNAPERRACPQCLNEATRKRMMPYLKVWHQVPGVKVCAVHKCRLLTMKKAYDMTTLSQPDNDAIDQNDIDYAVEIYARYLRTRSGEYFKPVGEKAADELILEKSDKIFLYAQCSCCKTRFLTTVYAVAKGRRCPVCDRKMDVIGRQLRMVPGYTPARRIKSLADTGVIRHSCGEDLAWRAGDIIWNSRRCGCQR